MAERPVGRTQDRPLASSRLRQALGRRDDFGLWIANRPDGASFHRHSRSRCAALRSRSAPRPGHRAGADFRALRRSVGAPPAAPSYHDRRRSRPRHAARFIPLAYAFDALTMEQLYVVAFLTGILSICFEVAYQSYLPSLIKREELLEGNSKLKASDSAAEVGAFGAAGWLVQLFTGPVAILIDAVSFLFSAFYIKRTTQTESPPAPNDERTGTLREAKEGIQTILGNAFLRTTIVSECLDHFAFGMFGAAFGLYVIRVLDFQPGV